MNQNMNSYSNIKILLVEDTEAIRLMYEMKFQREGFTVITAQDGEEGLQMAEEHKPDIVLLDLMMPVMNGQEMLHQMRKQDWGEHIKVFILTNVSKSEAPFELRAHVIENYIVKALHTPAQVVSIVEDCIR